MNGGTPIPGVHHSKHPGTIICSDFGVISNSLTEFHSVTNAYKLTFIHRLNISYANEKDIKCCLEQDLNFSLPDYYRPILATFEMQNLFLKNSELIIDYADDKRQETQKQQKLKETN